MFGSNCNDFGIGSLKISMGSANKSRETAHNPFCQAFLFNLQFLNARYELRYLFQLQPYGFLMKKILQELHALRIDLLLMIIRRVGGLHPQSCMSKASVQMLGRGKSPRSTAKGAPALRKLGVQKVLVKQDIPCLE